MHQLQQLDILIELSPPWSRIAMAIVLIAFSSIGIYGGINLDFGHKAFTRIPRSEIRSNWPHIFRYTISPLIMTIGYLYLLITKT